MAATMREVARRAGVSVATVSYVLNGQGAVRGISEATCSRVRRAMSELQYHPNALARGLSHRQTHTVAVVMQYPAIFSGWSGFTNELMHGITDTALEVGYDVLLHTRNVASDVEAVQEKHRRELSVLLDGRADGALLLRDEKDPLANALLEAGFPFVMMFSHSADKRHWFVDCDNMEGARLAVEYLLSLGHRRIAHLAGSDVSGAARERKQGYLKALADAGLPAEYQMVIDAFSVEHDLGPVVEMLSKSDGERPTAVFSWSDDVAINLISLLRQNGVRVPEDLSVVGFDSTTLCDHTDPPLTSVHQSVYNMAATAFRLLAANISGARPDETAVRVQPRLDIRKSCAPCTGSLSLP